MYIDLNQLGTVLIWVITGAIAGAAASFLVGRRNRNAVWDVIIGLVGAVLGGLIINALNIQVPSTPITIETRELIISFAGALIFLVLLRLLFRR